MESVKKTLENWLNEFDNFSFKDYEELPDLELYMDQVMTYLERQLQIFQTSSLDKQITPSMINNYVKGDVIPSPIQKKYSKEHLAAIEEVCTLKQVLTIAEVKQILDARYDGQVEKAEIFNSFNKLNNEVQDDAVKEAFKKLNDIDENDTLGLTKLSMEFALVANAYINISKRILFYIRVFENLEKLQEERAKANLTNEDQQ